MSRHTRPQRGLTMALAIFLLAMVSVALLVVAQLVRDDARRTFNEGQDAQLRVLVLAAIADVKAHLQHEGALAAKSSVTLPKEMIDTSLRYESTLMDGKWQVHVESVTNDRVLQCDCIFTAKGGNWSLQNSTLSQAVTDRRHSTPTTRTDR